MLNHFLGLIKLLEETEEFDPNTVTPGFIGFAATGIFALLAFFIMIDLTRRLRKNTARRLSAEKNAAAKSDADPGEAASL